MKKWFVLFCICAVSLHAVPFYQNPSPEAAYMWLEEQDLENAKEEDRPLAVLLAITFIAQVAKAHPEYIEQFAQDFPYFSHLKKMIFHNAFASAEINDIRIPRSPIQILPISALNRWEFTEGYNFDLMIVSFLATGNELFIRQPMAFLNSDPELLFFTYEWLNRLFLAEVLEHATGQKGLPDDAEFEKIIQSWPNAKKEQFALRAAAWECLAFIKELDPSAERTIVQLCKSDPTLDYQGTLAKILN